jgi:multisubunit Na+/H+ antiporter MnhG subunit
LIATTLLIVFGTALLILGVMCFLALENVPEENVGVGIAVVIITTVIGATLVYNGAVNLDTYIESKNEIQTNKQDESIR